ncbi:MAG: hypothetical protein H0X46_10285, partial [Bacteroidetes bacterium]|nr:hypothetical protein [Bacteroidota bacterium]
MQHVSEDLDYQLLYTQQVEENQQIRFQLNALQQQLSQLKKLIYGSRQERFIPTDNNPSQLTLSIESQAAVACNIIDTQKISYTRYTATVSEIKKDHPGRTKLPE